MGRTRREMTMAKACREFPLAEKAKPMLERLHAVLLPSGRDDAPDYTIETIVGTLSITVYEDWLACAFKDPERARLHLGQHVGPHSPRAVHNPRLNGFSGKWNWHWWEFAPRNSYDTPTVAIVTTALAAMLDAFETATLPLLPQPTPELSGSTAPGDPTMGTKSKAAKADKTETPKPADAAPAAAKPEREDVNAKHRAEALATVRKLTDEIKDLAEACCARIEKGGDAKATGEYAALKTAGDDLKTAINKLGLHAAPKASKAA